MKRKRSFQDNLSTLLFALTDEGVDFRSRWRTIATVSIYLLLSGFTMAASMYGVSQRLHIAIIIGLSLVKYAAMFMVIFTVGKKLAASYLDDVFELNDQDLAADFIEEVTFGYGHERITINEGRISEKDERSPIILIGGPGLIQVNLDSVALLEKLDGEPEIIHPRSKPWPIGRFERIREIGKHDEVGKREYAIINLRDQFVEGLRVTSRTKDGIPIEAQNIKLLFSVLRRRNNDGEDLEGDAYLFDPRGVESLVYNQTVITPEPSSETGIGFPWDTTIIPLVYAEIEDLIRTRTLSEILTSITQREIDQTDSNEQALTQMRVEMTGTHNTTKASSANAPNFESRSKITEQFYKEPFREKAAQLGVELDWIDIGTWQLPGTLILEKHKEAWDLMRKNAADRAALDRLRKQYETREVKNLINEIVIRKYEKPPISSRSSIPKDWEELGYEPKRKDDFTSKPPVDSNKRSAASTALEMLKAFRAEINAAKLLIESDSTIPYNKKMEDLAALEKTLRHINSLTGHWVNNQK